MIIDQCVLLSLVLPLKNQSKITIVNAEIKILYFGRLYFRVMRTWPSTSVRIPLRESCGPRKAVHGFSSPLFVLALDFRNKIEKISLPPAFIVVLYDEPFHE